MKRFLLGTFMMALGVHFSAWAEVKVLRSDLQQGGFLVGKVVPGSLVLFSGEDVAVDEKGIFVLGFDRQQALKNSLKVCRGNVCDEEKITLKKRKYVVQRVKNVPQNTVTPSAEEEKRAVEDTIEVKKAREAAWVAADRGENVDVLKAFDLPVRAPTSGVYGSSRTYNGEERSWHKGHDLAAPTGTTVRAPAGGIVRLARETFMSGNLIILDHGGGITTVYAHLSRMDVAERDAVKRGQVMGAVGTTGRSTGPHLHWGMYWRETAIDPILWVKAANR